jgi:hypothetical protein
MALYNEHDPVTGHSSPKEHEAEGEYKGPIGGGDFYNESDASSVEVLTGTSKVEAAQAVW